MATPGVGQDIEAMCGRCGQVWHVVMAKMGDRIAKVVCKRCGGHHRYRTEDAADETAGPDGRRPMSSPRRSRPRAAQTPTPMPMPPFDPSKPARTYRGTDSFAPGERVQHPSFGTGVVAGSPGAGKVEVVFPSGTRVLVCAKATSTLARPVAALDLPVSDRPPK
jgi:hypothetical protein